MSRTHRISASVAAASFAVALLTCSMPATAQPTTTSTEQSTVQTTAEQTTSATATSAPAESTKASTSKAAAPAAVQPEVGQAQPIAENTDCAQMTGQQALEKYVGEIGLPFPDRPARPENTWSMKSPTDTYDACADLSWIVVELSRGTGSSPRQAMFFHKGVYVGKALEESTGAPLVLERSSDELVRFTIHTSSDRGPTKGLKEIARSVFYWNDETNRLEHYGPLPWNTGTPVFRYEP